MLLSEKLAAFCAGIQISDIKSISFNDVSALEFSTAQPIKGLIFEGKNSLASQFIGDGLNCFIGFNSYINSGGYVRTDEGGVFIGRFCSFGRRLTLGAGTHRMSSLSTSPALRGVGSRPYSLEQKGFIRKVHVRPTSPLIIESDVWIGDGAIVMPGVRVGVGAVIAANAVVINDVPPYAIFAGVPAKQIGTRFHESIVQKLIDTKWWECDHSYICSLPLNNIFEFIAKFECQPTVYSTYRLL